MTKTNNSQTLDTKPPAQVLSVSGIVSEEKVLTGEQQSTKGKMNPKVFKEYQKLQQKYLSLYGKSLVRVNAKRRFRLQERMNFIKIRLQELEKNLYLDVE